MRSLLLRTSLRLRNFGLRNLLLRTSLRLRNFLLRIGFLLRTSLRLRPMRKEEERWPAVEVVRRPELLQEEEQLRFGLRQLRMCFDQLRCSSSTSLLELQRWNFGSR
ncbi:hypothetical protein [Rosistilla carotiformis]|uniref:hypothetical protein n=1 Tax=Rosistilla carotiformis TaxID=2528017 RepID=UPI001E398E9B|nr:hypothetical protein [Rosistilla carotiformis]